jgi:hypothetical protein
MLRSTAWQGKVTGTWNYISEDDALFPRREKKKRREAE